MAWITLNKTHVLDRMAGDELSSFENAGGNLDGDRLTGILSQITTLVRGKVSACSENIAKMGVVGTIPDELLWAAATLARTSLLNSLPAWTGELGPREKEIEEAHRQLNDVASCKFGIVSSDGIVTDSVGVFGGADLLDF